MKSIVVWWIGTAEPPAALLKAVQKQVERAFALPVPVPLVHAERPDAFDPRRGQHSSARVLAWLSARRPPFARKLLGITDADLFMPVLTFVYGEAQLGGEAAVVSTARLQPDPRAERLGKEAVHELGHTFGLVHCPSPGCVMARSVHIRDVDAKGGLPCRECRALLLEREEEP